MDYTKKNLSYTCVPIHYEQQERGCLNIDEFNEFLKEIYYGNIFKRTFFTVTLLCGLRRGEILALQWQDIDFDNSQIHIVWKDVKTLGLPKSGKARITWLPPLTKELLLKLKDKQVYDEPTNLIFKCRTGNRPGDKWVKRNFEKL